MIVKAGLNARPAEFKSIPKMSAQTAARALFKGPKKYQISTAGTKAKLSLAKFAWVYINI